MTLKPPYVRGCHAKRFAIRPSMITSMKIGSACDPPSYIG
jgi:hypothetical protein